MIVVFEDFEEWNVERIEEGECGWLCDVVSV